jgi:predicted transcriptional regulator
MTDRKNTQMNLTVIDGLQVAVLPNTDHEFLMTTKEVALGYGVTDYNIRQHKLQHQTELIEGKHFVIAVSIPNGGNIPHNAVLWTKRGIVRLGFFIKSERAKLFRDWAEELIISVTNEQLPTKRNHNRLTAERLVSIMADVCRIEDKELRMSITSKLLGKEVHHGTI